MSILQAIVLGVVQGISEFLPISSSGHLILIPQLFGWPDQGVVFDVTMHLATLSAVLWVFKDEVKKLVLGFVGKGEKADQKLAWMIIVATIPAVVVGVLFGDAIEATFRSAKLVAVSLIFWGVVLAIADRVAAKRITTPSPSSERRGEDQRGVIHWRNALAAGIGQAIALIPGGSRSGLSISGGLFTGLDRVTAARFSFLLGIPATAGAIALTFAKAYAHQTTIEWLPTLIGFCAALIAGILSIRWLLRILGKTSYIWFAAYRVLIAIIILFVA